MMKKYIKPIFEVLPVGELSALCTSPADENTTIGGNTSSGGSQGDGRGPRRTKVF